MKSKIRFIIICFIACYSCQHQAEQNGQNALSKSNTLNKSEMIAIMTDIFITEVHIHKLQQEGKDVKRLTIMYYEQVLSAHNTNDKILENSIKYYSSVGEYVTILEQVINNLVEMEIQAKSE